MLTTKYVSLLALGAAFLGAYANILARTILKDIKAQEILAINFLILGSTLAWISPIFFKVDLSPLVAILLLSIGIIDAFANYFYFKTFEGTEASVATPLLSLAPAFTFFFAYFFIGDTVSFGSFLLAISIIGLAVALTADFKNFSLSRKQTLYPALASSVLFGLSAIPTKYLINTLHATNAPTVYMIRASIIALFAGMILGFPKVEISLSKYRFLFLRGLVVIGQYLLLYTALGMSGSAGVTMTLANVSPAFALVLGWLLLKETPTPKKALVAVLIVLLSLLV